MSDMADAQADLLATSGELSSEETDKAFDMLKYYFAIANVVAMWRAGHGHWCWCEDHHALALQSTEPPPRVVEDD